MNKTTLWVIGGYVLVAAAVWAIFRAGKNAQAGTNQTSVADEAEKQIAAPTAQRLHLDVENINGVLQ